MAAKLKGAPLDDARVLWRFIDFSKLESMLEHNGLYFSRADLLGDPFEGSRSQKEDWARRVPPWPAFAEIREEQDFVERFNRWKRGWVYISCWHCNPHESAAMWILYARQQKAVALKSTVGRLREALDAQCIMGAVNYIDYFEESIPEEQWMNYLHKRHSFEHEKEVRAIFMDSFPPDLLRPGTYGTSDWNDVGPTGVWQPIAFSALVDHVVVAPEISPLFIEDVGNALKRYGVSVPVTRSTLEADPKF